MVVVFEGFTKEVDTEIGQWGGSVGFFAVSAIKNRKIAFASILVLSQNFYEMETKILRFGDKVVDLTTLLRYGLRVF